MWWVCYAVVVLFVSLVVFVFDCVCCGVVDYVVVAYYVVNVVVVVFVDVDFSICVFDGVVIFDC